MSYAQEVIDLKDRVEKVEDTLSRTILMIRDLSKGTAEIAKRIAEIQKAILSMRDTLH